MVTLPIILNDSNISIDRDMQRFIEYNKKYHLPLMYPSKFNHKHIMFNSYNSKIQTVNYLSNYSALIRNKVINRILTNYRKVLPFPTFSDLNYMIRYSRTNCPFNDITLDRIILESMFDSNEYMKHLYLYRNNKDINRHQILNDKLISKENNKPDRLDLYKFTIFKNQFEIINDTIVFKHDIELPPIQVDKLKTIPFIYDLTFIPILDYYDIKLTF